MFVKHPTCLLRNVIHCYDRIPNLLINRLVLNLRSISSSDSNISSSNYSTSASSELAFAHGYWLGNIGAPLEQTRWDSYLDEDSSQVTTGRKHIRAFRLEMGRNTQRTNLNNFPHDVRTFYMFPGIELAPDM